MDTVFINQLEVETVIGVYDWERTIKQRLILDLEMAWDNKIAGESDKLSDALNYFDLSQDVLSLVESSRFELIESVAEHTAKMINEKYGVTRVVVTVYKPTAVANAQSVGVNIIREFPA